MLSNTLRMGMVAMVMCGALASLAGSQEITTRVSVRSDGDQGNGTDWSAALSRDGRYVVFGSHSDDLVPGDTNGAADVFVHDRVTGETVLVSVNDAGVQGNDTSWFPAISADGRYVAYKSQATNLVAGDTNGFVDIFVYDRQAGQVKRVSISSTGVEANDYSGGVNITPDGRFVAFTSRASNLVPNDANYTSDAFVHDCLTATTTCVSVSSSGAEGPLGGGGSSISADGRFYTFSAQSRHLVSGDTNGDLDVFVRDRQLGTTTRVSVTTSGSQVLGDSYDSSISDDGRYIAFRSISADFVPLDTNGEEDVFLHDRQTGETIRVSEGPLGIQANDWSFSPMVSADGGHVAYLSHADNLVPGDTNGVPDVFAYGIRSGTTSRVSVDRSGVEANDGSSSPFISADGRLVAFSSHATNLVPGDTNGRRDIFLHERALASATPRNAGMNPDSYEVIDLAVLGDTYLGVIRATATTGHSRAWLFGFSTPTTLSLSGGQTLLVNVADPSGELLGQLPMPGHVAIYALPVPSDPMLSGFEIHSQALHFGNVQPFALSNAQHLIVGR